MTEPYELPQRPKTDAWIDRVRQADAAAEGCWANAESFQAFDEATLVAYIRAIAAELRAARIARRPGAGQ